MIFPTHGWRKTKRRQIGDVGIRTIPVGGTPGRGSLQTGEGAGVLSDSRGHLTDALRAEAGPVVGLGHNNRCLEVTEGEDVVAGLIVQADVHELVVQAGAIKGLLGCGALDAGWLGVNSDGHVFGPFSLSAPAAVGWNLISLFRFY